MNYELLQKHIDENTHFDAVPVLKEDGSNANDFYSADVVGNRRFAQNYGGYPRSEIAEINEAANLQTQMSLLNDLCDMSPSGNPNAGRTDAEIMLGHRSKYVQCPSETVSWLEEQISIRDVKRVDNEISVSKPTESTGEVEDVIDKV